MITLLLSLFIVLQSQLQSSQEEEINSKWLLGKKLLGKNYCMFLKRNVNSLINQKLYCGVHSKNCRLADKKLNISERGWKINQMQVDIVLQYVCALCLYGIAKNSHLLRTASPRSPFCLHCSQMFLLGEYAVL